MPDTSDTTIVFPPDPEHLERDPRCLGCGYRLAGLSHASCPECGRRFDPKFERTYSWRRPFVWHRYWWPGALLALGSGFLWATLFYRVGALGWGMFIGLPFMLGTVVGYGGRFNGWMGAVVGPVVVVVTVVVLVAGLVAGGMAGFFCGGILLVFLVPIAVGGLFLGVLAARALAGVLKQTAFSQREHLPLLLFFLLLPGLAHLLQLVCTDPLGPETVRTSRVLLMDADTAWRNRLFYEEVEGPRPWLHRVGLPMPEEIEGTLTRPGDRAVYHYSGGGYVVKHATDIEPRQWLVFEVQEQHGFEDGSVRFIRGRYDFTPIAPDQTRVTLTSHYQPMLRPRVLWQPIERAMAGQLHGHILSGMQRQGARDRYTQTNTGKDRPQ